MLGHSYSDNLFSNTQPELPLVKLYAISSLPGLVSQCSFLVGDFFLNTFSVISFFIVKIIVPYNVRFFVAQTSYVFILTALGYLPFFMLAV